MTILMDFASGKLEQVLSTYSTDTSYPARVATITEPTGDGVLDLTGTPQQLKYLNLIPIGTSAADQTMKVLVLGWRLITTVWVPIALAELTATLSAKTGVNATELENEIFLADTITLTTGFDTSKVKLSSMAGDIIAHAELELEGFRKVEILFNRNSSSASCNALYWMR